MPEPTDAETIATVKRAALQGCVDYIRKNGQKGKTRDDDSKTFLAGAAAVAKLSDVTLDMPPEDGGYVDVLEALAAT